MKLRHSDSLLVIWRIAEFEGRQLKASVIEPTHLLLGLCKIVDVDLPTLLVRESLERDQILEELLREVRRLRNVFRAVGLDAKAFRRRLRREVGGKRFSPSESDHLRRSTDAKQVFADAEHFAEISDSSVFPAHLLYAVLLAQDDKRDGLLLECGIDKKRFQQVAKREILFQSDNADLRPKRNKAYLN